jgi:hypothetical protein
MPKETGETPKQNPEIYNMNKGVEFPQDSEVSYETAILQETPTLSEHEETARKEYVEHQTDSFEQRIKEEAKTMAEEFRQHIESTGPDESREKARDLKIEVDRTCDYLVVELRILTQGRGQAQLRASVSMNLALETLIHRAEDLKEDLLSEGPSTNQDQDAIKPDVSTVRRLLERLLKPLLEAKDNLWSLISSLLTPKEWTLKGDVKAIPFFVSGGMEIKFGPSGYPPRR